MQIEQLRVVITEDDLNAWLATALAGQRLDVRDVRIRVENGGIRVQGVYETRIMDVPFDSLWEPSVVRGQVGARLAAFAPMGGAAGKAFGLADFLAKGSLRGMIMQGLADAVAHQPGLRVEGDSLFCDVDRLIAEQGFSVRTNLTTIRCAPGQVTIEAGTA